MSRYVNLDEKVTAEFYDEEHEERFVKETTVEDVLSICDSYTEVDAEPVIRCKDCKNYGTSDCAMFLEKNENGCKEDYMWNELTDFCSWAERKEE